MICWWNTENCIDFYRALTWVSSELQDWRRLWRFACSFCMHILYVLCTWSRPLGMMPFTYLPWLHVHLHVFSSLIPPLSHLSFLHLLSVLFCFSFVIARTKNGDHDGGNLLHLENKRLTLLATSFAIALKFCFVLVGQMLSSHEPILKVPTFLYLRKWNDFSHLFCKYDELHC